MRFRLRLLRRIINENRIGLVPPITKGVGRVRGGDFLICPNLLQLLVALHAQVVIIGRQAELVTAPDRSHLVAQVGRHDHVAHGLDVLGARGRPDDDGEGVDAVLEKEPGVGPGEEVFGLGPGRAIEEGAVQIDNNKQVFCLSCELRNGVARLKILWSRIGHASRSR